MAEKGNRIIDLKTFIIIVPIFAYLLIYLKEFAFFDTLDIDKSFISINILDTAINTYKNNFVIVNKIGLLLEIRKTNSLYFMNKKNH